MAWTTSQPDLEMERETRFELVTNGLEGRDSTWLSYSRNEMG
jgi:hypothetical protein